MKILVIGNGAREHAIVDKLNNSNNEIWAFPGNPGIFEIALRPDIKEFNFETIAEFVLKNKIELVVVGPEQPLADGIVDFLESKGVKVFGPSKLASEIESSKAFAKQMMKQFHIPTADFQIFSKNEKQIALDLCKTICGTVVIKADGLAAGKGVAICETFKSAEKTIEEYFDGKFGGAGDKIVVEQYLEGEEVSIFIITDGEDYIILPSAQDHKRVYDGDIGPNTGGMGAYSPAPIITKQLLEEIERSIIKPTLKGMSKLGRTFRGCLYVGLMITKEGLPKVIEYNCRFGDPETQAVLQLIEGEFDQLLLSVANHKINKNTIKIIQNKYSSCVVVASGGYPDKFETGFEIRGLNAVDYDKIKIYQAGTKLDNKILTTNGGRVLCLVSTDDDFKSSLINIYQNINKIQFQNCHYRKDIGHRALKLLEQNG